MYCRRMYCKGPSWLKLVETVFVLVHFESRDFMKILYKVKIPRFLLR